MKTLIAFSAAALIFASASAQERTTPTATGPEIKPAINVQPQQNTQKSADPKSSNPTKTESKKSSAPKESATPVIDNKIAVSDPGSPSSGKANDKKKAPAKNPSEKKAPVSGVSPK